MQWKVQDLFATELSLAWYKEWKLCLYVFILGCLTQLKIVTAKSIHSRINTQARIISWCHSDFAVMADFASGPLAVARLQSARSQELILHIQWSLLLRLVELKQVQFLTSIELKLVCKTSVTCTCQLTLGSVSSCLGQNNLTIIYPFVEAFARIPDWFSDNIQVLSLFG